MNKLIFIIFILSSVSIYGMEKKDNKKNEKLTNYESLKELSDEDSELETRINNPHKNISINNGPKEHIVTIYQERGSTVIYQDKDLIIKNPDSLKIRAAKAAWKAYCTPKGFKNCACGTLAIVMIIGIYKIILALESMGSSPISK